MSWLPATLCWRPGSQFSCYLIACDALLARGELTLIKRLFKMRLQLKDKMREEPFRNLYSTVFLLLIFKANHSRVLTTYRSCCVSQVFCSKAKPWVGGQKLKGEELMSDRWGVIQKVKVMGAFSALCGALMAGLLGLYLIKVLEEC